MFVNLSIRRKLFMGMSLVACISVLGMGIIGFWATVRIVRASALNELNNEVNLIYGQIQSSVDSSIKNYLRAVAEKDTDIVKHYYQEFKVGNLTEAEAKAEATRALLSQKIGKSGYVYVVDSQGVLRVHPVPENVNRNISEYQFVQQQIKEKYGYVEYQWKNPGEKIERPKAVYMDYFKPWDWIISASSYREEFNTLVDIKNMRNRILAIKIGKTGYPYVLDTRGNLIIHPTQEGKNLYDSKDEKGNYLIRNMIKNKNGQIKYLWKNPGDVESRERIVIYKYLPELNYIVAAVIIQDDLYAAAGQYNPIIVVAVVVSVLLALVVSVLIARSLSRPIINLKLASEEIAAGDYSKQVKVLSRDEIGDLARVFNDMVAQIETNSKELQAKKEQLEKFSQHLEEMVQERTAELEDTNKELSQAKNYLMKTSGDLQRLLDNTGQGFLYFNKELLCGSEYSAECLRIFGCQDITGCNIVELLFPGNDERQALATRILGNVFTKEPDMRGVYLSLLPNEAKFLERTVNLEYKTIIRSTKTTDDITMMIILTDITEKRNLQQQMEDEKNVLRMVVSAVGNYRDFKYLIDDYRDFCNSLNDFAHKQVLTPQLLREIYVIIHTFKGNFSQMYMTHMVARLHDLESKIGSLKQDEKIASTKIHELLSSQELENWLNEDLEVLKRVMGESLLDKSDIVEIEIEKLCEIEQLVRTAFQPSESRQLLSKLRNLRYQPLRALLRSYPDYVRDLAERLGKCINPIVIEKGDFLVDPKRYYDFVKSLVHVFRNSVDHGIELPEERVKKGKEEFGNISCEAVLVDGCFVLKIADDGRGLDIKRIKEKAIAGGICSPETADSLGSEEVYQLIFAEGISTKDEVTKVSGRGIGLNAVSNAVLALNGKIEINSNPDEGTTFCFIIPNQETWD